MRVGLQVAYWRSIRAIVAEWEHWLGFHASLVKAARTDEEIARWVGRLGT